MTQIENQIRTFIAIRFTDEIRNRIKVFADKFSSLPGNYRWVSPETMHLTLQFLGDIDARLIPKVMSACQIAVREVPPFRIELAGCGVFPNIKRPRVVWIGIKEGQNNVVALHGILSKQLTGIGLKLEERPYSPHLTFGRIKFLKKTAALKQAIEKNSSEIIGGLAVSKISVFRSELSPEGPSYKIMGETYLKGD